jgi:hypothetical protein
MCAGTGPHASTWPQSFVIEPHVYPFAAHVSVGVHCWHWCVALHDPPPPHAGQTSVPPQPSSPVPHCQPSCAHVFGVHPHWFATPEPPHVFGAVHDPQSSVAPHPSETGPQFAFAVAHVFGVQVPAPHL